MVCIKQYYECDLIKTERFKNKNGEWVERELSKAVLQSGAKPSVLSEQSKYHTVPEVQKQTDPAERKRKREIIIIEQAETQVKSRSYVCEL